MFSAKTFTVLILLMLFCLTSDCDAWRRRRRRRAPPPCPVKNCDITLWSYWSYCSTDQCGQQGSQERLYQSHHVVEQNALKTFPKLGSALVVKQLTANLATGQNGAVVQPFVAY